MPISYEPLFGPGRQDEYSPKHEGQGAGQGSPINSVVFTFYPQPVV